jgi:tRNA(Ile)-lysidine synthase
MRAARASGPDGLAGMAALVEHREARLLRPLLGVSRARLTATLEARGWLDRRSLERGPPLRARPRAPGRRRAVAGADEAGRAAARDRRLAEARSRPLESSRPGSPWINLSCRAGVRKLQHGC